MVGLSCGTLRAEVKLSGLFGDNMVLQRDGDAPVWGTADAGETVTLLVQDQKQTATADGVGKWKATFHGLKAGTNLTLTVAGKSNTVTLHNVDVGEVWLCGGQSNMNYELRDADELAAANDPDLRCFFVPSGMSDSPGADVSGAWQMTTPKTAVAFPAVGYYFGKNLRQKLGVPVGLIRVSWNGMFIEPFIPADQFDAVPALKADLEKHLENSRDLSANIQKYTADMQAWLAKVGRADRENKGFAAKWADPALDTKDWIPTITPGDWSKIGAPNGGVVWVRKTVTLPPEAAGKDFHLVFPLVRDTDTTYFNGEKIGEGGAIGSHVGGERREYPVPGRLVKAGDNVIAVRVVCEQQVNPIFCEPGALNLPVPNNAANTNDWVAKVETEYPALTADQPPMPQPPFIDPRPMPGSIFNAMINPLTLFGIKGAIWYQGEANADNGWAYRTYLPMLIAGWREHWKIGDFPFYIVQLANFMEPPKGPGEGDIHWAQLREAQLLTWEKTAHTGMSVTIDIGETDNVHPANKKEVGYRLSLFALANDYGEKIEYSGPLYQGMTVEGGKVRLKFTHLGGGLVAKGGPLQQFIICGADKKWAAGDAVIDGDTVVVSSPDVPAPVAVRYAFANNPLGCNLYNKEGLPASPFRTDDWPMGMENTW